MLTRSEKEDQVTLLKSRIDRASSMLAIDYCGLTVDEITDLRAQLRAAAPEQTECRVAKNTLLKRATAGTSFDGLASCLKGPTAIAFAFDEPSAVAKVLVDFAKANDKLEIKGGVVDGETVDVSQIERLAELPTKHELRGMLAGTIQAPMRNLAGTLNALLGNLRNALEQRQGQLETS